MKLQVFSVHDGAVDAFMQPFYARSKAEALRMLTDTAQDPGSQFAKHPEDFALFHLGTYDDQVGGFELLGAPDHVISVLSLISQED